MDRSDMDEKWAYVADNFSNKQYKEASTHLRVEGEIIFIEDIEFGNQNILYQIQITNEQRRSLNFINANISRRGIGTVRIEIKSSKVSSFSLSAVHIYQLHSLVNVRPNFAKMLLLSDDEIE